MRAYEGDAATVGPHNSPGFLLWFVSRRWQAMLAARLADLDLTPAQLLVLASVGWLADIEKQTPTQRKVAEHAGTDPMMTSQILRALEERGLVSRKADSEDARAIRVATTSAGSKLVLAATDRLRAIDRDVFDKHTNRRELVSQLRPLAESLGARPSATEKKKKRG